MKTTSRRNQDRLAAKAARKAQGKPPVSKYAKKNPRPTTSDAE